MSTFMCIKPGCGTKYESDAEEAYYCPACDAERKSVAADLDARFNTVGQIPNDMFAGSKEITSPDGHKANFFRA